MHPYDQSLFVIAAIENADATTLRQTLDATPEEIVVEVFARRRLERKNLAALRVDAGHDVLDRAVLTRRVHCLKYEQHRPTVLRIKHVLKLGQEIDAHSERFLGARLVLGRTLQRVVGVDVLEAKTVVGYAERLGKLARLLDQVFHFFVVHLFTSFLFISHPKVFRCASQSATHYSIATTHSAGSSGRAPFGRTAPPICRSRQRSGPCTPRS